MSYFAETAFQLPISSCRGLTGLKRPLSISPSGSFLWWMLRHLICTAECMCVPSLSEVCACSGRSGQGREQLIASIRGSVRVTVKHMQAVLSQMSITVQDICNPICVWPRWEGAGPLCPVFLSCPDPLCPRKALPRMSLPSMACRFSL